jgi:hypothetical protein
MKRYKNRGTQLRRAKVRRNYRKKLIDHIDE